MTITPNEGATPAVAIPTPQTDLTSPGQVRGEIIRRLRAAGYEGPLDGGADFTAAALGIAKAALPEELSSFLTLLLLNREYEHLAEIEIYRAALAKAEEGRS